MATNRGRKAKILTATKISAEARQKNKNPPSPPRLFRPLRRLKILSSAALGLLLLPVLGAQDSSNGQPPQSQETERLTFEAILRIAAERAPSLLSAKNSLGAAEAVYRQVLAKNGLSLGSSAGFTHGGSLPGSKIPSGLSTNLPSPGSSSYDTAANETIRAELSLSGPQTSVGLAASHVIGSGLLADGTEKAGQNTSLDLSVNQTIFDAYPGGRAAAAVKQGELTYYLARLGYEKAVLDFNQELKQALAAFVSAVNNVKSKEATLEKNREDLERSRVFHRSGRVSDLDLRQSEIAFARAELDRKAADQGKENALRKILLLVGLGEDRTVASLEGGIADFLPADRQRLSLRDLLPLALAQRPEPKTLETNRALARISLDLALSQASPVIAVSGGASLRQDWSTGTTTGSFNAGASLSLPIIDGGLLQAQKDQYRLALDNYDIQEKQQRNSIENEVSLALFGVEDAEARLSLAKESLDLASGKYELQKTRFASGLIPYLDVLTASSDLGDAEAAYSAAQNALLTAQLALDKALGR